MCKAYLDAVLSFTVYVHHMLSTEGILCPWRGTDVRLYKS